MAGFLSEKLPPLETGAIGQGKAGQEISPVEFSGRFQPGQASRTQGLARRVVGPAGSEADLELGHVQPMVAGRIELHLLGCNQQVRNWALRDSQGLAKLEERLAQVVARRVRRMVRPEQVGQSFPAVRPVGFNGQEGQQSAHLIGGKGGQGDIVQRYPEGAEQGNRQMWHLFSSAILKNSTAHNLET